MTHHDARNQRTRRPALWLAGLLLTLWTSGCAHIDAPNAYDRSGAVMTLPKLTAVTAGPVALLLANGPAFHADFTMTFEDPPKPPLTWAGQIFVRDGNFRMVAAMVQAAGKKLGAGEFGVMWDTTANEGYVVSETLQGYAPIKAAVRFTNQLTQVVAGPTQRIAGHPVDQANVTVADNFGDALVLQVRRAVDAGNLPLEIHSPPGDAQSFALSLSGLKLVPPAADWFVPPDGFTRYESEKAMMDEMADRLLSVDKKTPMQPIGTGPGTSQSPLIH